MFGGDPPSPPRPEGVQGEIPTDSLFDILRDERRRYVLYYLENESNPASLDELAEAVASWSHDVGTADLPDELHRSARNSLHHCHVPRLESVGVVEYDVDQQTVTLADAAEETEPFLKLAALRDFA